MGYNKTQLSTEVTNSEMTRRFTKVQTGKDSTANYWVSQVRLLGMAESVLFKLWPGTIDWYFPDFSHTLIVSSQHCDCFQMMGHMESGLMDSGCLSRPSWPTPTRDPLGEFGSFLLC